MKTKDGLTVYGSLEARMTIGQEIEAELEKARSKHKPMNGPHEGYAVILEELDEMWDEVKRQAQDPVRMRKEALQVGAMAARFIQDVCDPAIKRSEEERRNACNRHGDCKAAEAALFAKEGRHPGVNFHCHTEDCEDCFGK
jgi:hypothetical protein